MKVVPVVVPTKVPPQFPVYNLSVAPVVSDPFAVIVVELPTQIVEGAAVSTVTFEGTGNTLIVIDKHAEAGQEVLSVRA